jgi:pilus assembly protein CpaF
MRVDSWSPELRHALRPLLPYLGEDGINDIAANGPSSIWIRGAATRGWRRVEDCGWNDLAHFENACTRISDVIGRTVNSQRPLLDARLPGGERVNIVLPPACAAGALTIRSFPTQIMSLERLETLGMFGGDSANARGGRPSNSRACVRPRTVRELLEALVLGRASIIVAGSTGAGKTSVLNALSALISPYERVVSVENARELQFQNPNWVALETVERVYREDPGVSSSDLVRNSLRMAPDRIIVGEVRDSDSLDLLRALSTGHRGGFGTVHANGALDALLQLQVLALSGESCPPAETVLSMIARAVDVVIHCEFDEDHGLRRIGEVIELERYPNGTATAPGSAHAHRNLVDDRGLFPDPLSDRMSRLLTRGMLAREPANSELPSHFSNQ